MFLKNKSVPTSFPEITSQMHRQNLHACLTWLITRLWPSVRCSLCHDTPRTDLDFTLWTVGTKCFHYTMFYQREYGTGAHHRLFAIPSCLYHKELCLHSQCLTPSTQVFQSLWHDTQLVLHFLAIFQCPQEECIYIPTSCWKASFPKGSHHLLWNFSILTHLCEEFWPLWPDCTGITQSSRLFRHI